MNYPNGMKRQTKRSNQKHKTKTTRQQSFQNRGMSLENDLNETNLFYLETNKAIIHKKPTPIQVVNVNYPRRSAAVITEAYFQKPSTTDYNGLYKGKHIDFEAKETKNKTTFPLSNIHDHQINHMKSVAQHGGISFFIIRFAFHDETYLIPLAAILPFWEESLKDGKKSISYKDIQVNGHLIPFKFQPRIDYLTVIHELYF